VGNSAIPLAGEPTFEVEGKTGGGIGAFADKARNIIERVKLVARYLGLWPSLRLGAAERRVDHPTGNRPHHSFPLIVASADLDYFRGAGRHERSFVIVTTAAARFLRAN
jgi:hypothetical protein